MSQRPRERLLSVIDACGYVPDAFSRGLGLNTALPNATDPCFPRLLICLERAFHSCGYDRVLNCAERRPGAERMINRHADGMVRWAPPFLRMTAGSQGRPRQVLVMLSVVIRGAPSCAA